MSRGSCSLALLAIAALWMATSASQLTLGFGVSATSWESSITFNVSNPHPYAFNSTPVVLSLDFSRGEAVNNSVGVRDSSGRWLPSQLSDVEFYQDSDYIKSCNVVFLANLTARSNSSFTVTYSSHPVHYNLSLGQSSLRVRSSGPSSDIIIENEYYNISIGAGSTIGLIGATHAGSKDGLTWMNNSLLGPAFLTGGVLSVPKDLSRLRVAVKNAGPVAAEVELSGQVASMRVDLRLRFYAKNPTIHAEVEVENLGSKVTWFYALYALLNATRMAGLITCEGRRMRIEELSDIVALPPQNWTALEFEDGSALAYSISPLNSTLGEVVSLTDGYVLFATVGNSTDVGEPGSKTKYDVALTFLRSFNRRALDATYSILSVPLNVTIQRREFLAALEAPSDGLVLEKLRIAASLSALGDIQSINLSISLSPESARIVAGETPVGPFSLARGQELRYEWRAQFFAAGDYYVTLTCKAKGSVVVRETKIRISSPTILPKNKFKLHVLDSERRASVGLVNISLYTPDGTELVASAVTNGTGYSELQLDPGRYRVQVYKNGRLIASETLALSSSTLVYNITAWAYTIRVRVRPTWSKPLVAVFMNTTKGLQLISYNNTDEEGTAELGGVFNGSYILKAYMWHAEARSVKISVERSGQEFYVDLPISVVRVTAVSESNVPLENATVSLYDSNQGLLEDVKTDASGTATFLSVPTGNYTFVVKWLGIRVFSGWLDVDKGLVEYRAVARVLELRVKFTDPLGTPLSGGTVELEREGSAQGLLRLSVSNDGILSTMLPVGNYTLRFRGGLFSKDVKVSLFNPLDMVVFCDLSASIPVALAVTGACWAGTVFMWQAKTRRVSLEEMKLKDMIEKLDALYQQGEVDEAMYSRIREEYTTRLRRVRG